MDFPSKITKTKLKRCENTAGARSLSKISCKIGDHFENAYINTGSSISIASTDLYRKLLADKCTFTNGTATLNLIDETIPNQEYRVTTTTVKVIGKSKTINLVTFPDHFAQRTTLGMDFLSTKSSTMSKDDAVFRVPEQPAPKSNPIHSEQIDDENQPPVTVLDWILNSNNLLKKPLYNILADGTADDDDLFAICAFMKRMPRMVSPIRSLKDLSSCMEKQVVTELTETSLDIIDRAPDSAPHPLTKQSNTTKTPTPSTTLLDKENDKAVSSSTNHDTTTLKTAVPSTVPLDKLKEKGHNSTSMSQTIMLKTSTPATTSVEPTEVIGSPSSSSKNETIKSTTSAQSTKSLDEKVISSSSKNEIETTKKPTPSSETDMDRDLDMNQRHPSSSSNNQTNISKTSTTSSERSNEKAISPSSKNQSSTPRMSTTSLKKEKEKDVSPTVKNQTATPRVSLTSLEKEREKILSLLSNTQTKTPRSSTSTSTDKAKEKAISSSSKNHTAMSRTSTPSTASSYKASSNHTAASRTSTPSSSYKAREKVISSSSGNQTAICRAPTSSLDRAKERVRSSSSKNVTSRTPSTLAREKENTYHQVPPPKYGRP